MENIADAQFSLDVLGVDTKEEELAAFRAWVDALSARELEQVFQNLFIFCATEMGIDLEWLLDRPRREVIVALEVAWIYLYALYRASQVRGFVQMYRDIDSSLQKSTARIVTDASAFRRRLRDFLEWEE
jgi:hypothetical protein